MTHGSNPDDRRWKNQALVRERDERRIRLLWRSLAGIVIALAPVAAYLFEQNRCLLWTYEMSGLRAEQETLIERERDLKTQRARLDSLPQIESWASSRTGLTRPDAAHVIVVGPPRPITDDLVAGVPTAESPSAR